MTDTKFAIPINSDNTIHHNIGNTFAITICKDDKISTIITHTATTNSLQKTIAELKEQNIEAILCKNADYRVLTYIEDLNIQAFRISENISTIEEAITEKLNNKLAPIVKMHTCGGACDF